MCYYITATLPNGKEIEKVKDILEKNEMKFSQINNKSVQSYLKTEQLYFRPTKTYCDCDTALGAFNRQNEYNKLFQSQKVRKLKKKKWTQEQIDNWIWEKIHKTKPHLKKFITPVERKNEIEAWFNILHKVINLENVSRIGILKHWYKSSLENEEIVLKKIEKVNLNEIEKEFLFTLEEDVLYEFSVFANQ